MDKAQPDPLSLQRNVILGLLLALAAAAWTVLFWHDHNTMHTTMAPSSMGLRAALFLAMWAVMMVAMMFPTAAPIILAFHRTQADKHQVHNAFVATWVFVAAYLLVWWGFAVYAGTLGSGASDLRAASSAELGGVIIMIAGLYQLTPLKEFFLSKCRTPIEFTVTSWRGGTAGAVEMGLLHGLYCLGCCWMLFVILFPLGMTVVAMAAVTLIILAEKTLPWPRAVSYSVGAMLVLYGALLTVTPQLFPTVGKNSNATMPAEMPMKMLATGSAPIMK